MRAAKPWDPRQHEDRAAWARTNPDPATSPRGLSSTDIIAFWTGRARSIAERRRPCEAGKPRVRERSKRGVHPVKEFPMESLPCNESIFRPMVHRPPLARPHRCRPMFAQPLKRGSFIPRIFRSLV